MQSVQASPWIQRWAHLLPANARVLDVAAGSGRHSLYLTGLGHRVTAVDRDGAALATYPAHISTVQADLENGAPWPFASAVAEPFDAIVVTNYLHRPLFPSLLGSLAAGGVLLYETFGVGQAQLGRPSNPEFLLRPSELLALCAGLQVVAYEEGLVKHSGSPAQVQRICARRAQNPMPDLTITLPE